MTVEPRVEELLASIRKAIDNDLDGDSNTSGNSRGTLMRGALREMRVNFEDNANNREQADGEIAKLRERIGRSRIESSFTAPSLPKERPAPRIQPTGAPRQSEFSSILAGPLRPNPPNLRQTLDGDDLAYIHQQQHQAPSVPPYDEAVWEEPAVYAEPPPQAYYQTEQQSALISPQTAYATQNSFQNLADSILARATSDRGLENMTQDLLRGMLKNWLDDNLPDLVERLVREEIERVARRGR